MAIDLDDIGSFGEEELNPTPRFGPTYGLIVSEKAKTGEELVEQAELFMRQAKVSPLVFFEEEDADTGETVFLNGPTWAQAMKIDYMPSEAECLAWEREQLSKLA
jgi:hypothetical protein